ncbi:C5a anaphylatoxin chemotactic receptor 1-like [Lepisosteus oculatus]|uniref:Complement C5a receptor 1 n=1 Tax=Lepisosteus oculatus TaxID=7918 RepID=W5NM12_LEPOC|nr:PREDICTED: C5a anaphylatoxin chemotactic receptor 1-like [Lepisosteus oculatus]
MNNFSYTADGSNYSIAFNQSDYDDWDNYSDWSSDSSSPFGKEQLIFMVIYSLVLLLGVPGNTLVIWISGFRMKRSVNTTWFLNLAVADLLCCLSLPFLISTLAMDYHWPFGNVACKVINALIFLNMFCSIFLLTVISLDRLLLVSRPVWCQNWRTAAKAQWVCLLVWVLALLFCTPLFIYRVELHDPLANKILCHSSYSDSEGVGFAVLRFLVGFLGPFVVIVMCHYVVYTKANQGRSKSHKTLRVICAVVLGFFVCWFPYHIVGFFLALTPSNSPQMFYIRQADIFCLCLAYLNSCLNPLLYVCVGRSFKDSLRRSLKSVMVNFLSEDSHKASLSGPSMTTMTSDKPRENLC